MKCHDRIADKLPNYYLRTVDLSPKNSAIRLMRFPLNWDKRRSHHEEALQRRTNYPCY